MPIHDLGYRNWSGARSSHRMRPLTVARNGVSLIWRSKWLRLMLLLGWIPATFFAVGIGLFEYSNTDPTVRQAAVAFAAGPLDQPELALRIAADPASARPGLWSACIFGFFRYPQLVTMVVLIGLIAPRLVSYDLRSKAYLQYFARPLTPLEYVIGKSAVIWFFLGMITTLPALILYVIGVMLSPDLSVVYDTWDIPFRILAATVVLVVPTTAVAVCFSSLTHESRYATFAWFAMWIMGGVAYLILTYAGVRPPGNPPEVIGPGPIAIERPAHQEDNPTNPHSIRLVAFQADRFGPGGDFNRPNQGRERDERGRRRRVRNQPDWEALGVDFDKWTLVSPYHVLGKAQSWVFGLENQRDVEQAETFQSLKDQDPRMAEWIKQGISDLGEQESDESVNTQKRDTVTAPLVMLSAVTLLSTWITRRRLVKRLSL